MGVVVGIAMVRDEVDIIETTILHMLGQVDALVVADNRSVDGTEQFLRSCADRFGRRFQLVLDNEVGYEQSAKMTALARQAHEWFGADWVVPFDADEVWYSPNRTIKQMLQSRPENETIVPAALYDHVRTAVDPDDHSAVYSMQWRRNLPAPLQKVACRYRDDLVIGMGNHEAFYDRPFNTSEHRLAIRHFPYRSVEQTIRKIRNGAEAYAATDLPEHYGAHWRGWGRILAEHGEDAIAELFRKWHWREHPDRPHVIDGEHQDALRFDPAPELLSTSTLP